MHTEPTSATRPPLMENCAEAYFKQHPEAPRDYAEAYFRQHPDAPEDHAEAYFKQHPEGPKHYEAYFKQHPDAPQGLRRARPTLSTQTSRSQRARRLHSEKCAL